MSLRWPFIGVRVPPREHARVERFARASRGLPAGGRSSAVRALLALGLDAAARPAWRDERWCDLHDALARIDALLDALGRAVSANPALLAWLLGQIPDGRQAPSADALAQSLEALLEADWDERCRLRGVPRARPVPQAARALRETPRDAAAPQQRRRLVATTVRLSERDVQRVLAYATRVDLGRQAALAQLVQRGLDATDADAARDDVDRLLDSARRIELRLDLIGALTTSPASVVLHLWRHLTGRTEEWERVLLHEVQAVAEATWHALRSAAAQPLPGSLALDPSDETEGDGWPS